MLLFSQIHPPPKGRGFLWHQVKKIEEISSCPHCGSTFGYYSRARVSGVVHDNVLFKTREPYNFGMHDSLDYKELGKYYYCMECNKPICKK